MLLFWLWNLTINYSWKFYSIQIYVLLLTEGNGKPPSQIHDTWDCEYAAAPFCGTDMPSWRLIWSITRRHYIIIIRTFVTRAVSANILNLRCRKMSTADITVTVAGDVHFWMVSTFRLHEILNSQCFDSYCC